MARYHLVLSFVAAPLVAVACSREPARQGEPSPRAGASAIAPSTASAPTAASVASALSSSGAPVASAPPSASAAPAGPAELALVQPLHDGLEVEGWKVERVGGVEGGTMRVVMTRDESRVALEIALDDAAGPAPPARAGRYAIYYSAHRATPDDASRLARWLAKILEKNKAAPPPRDLGHFSPTAKPERPI